MRLRDLVSGLICLSVVRRQPYGSTVEWCNDQTTIRSEDLRENTQFKRLQKQIKHACVQRGIGTALDADQTQERDQSHMEWLTTVTQDKAQDLFKRRIKGKNVPLFAQLSAAAPSAQPAADQSSVGTAPADIPRVSQGEAGPSRLAGTLDDEDDFEQTEHLEEKILPVHPAKASSRKQLEDEHSVSRQVEEYRQVTVFKMLKGQKKRTRKIPEAARNNQAAGPNQAGAAAQRQPLTALENMSISDLAEFIEGKPAGRTRKLSKAKVKSNSNRKPLTEQDVNIQATSMPQDQQKELDEGDNKESDDGSPGGTMADMEKTFGHLYSNPSQASQDSPAAYLQIYQHCKKAWQAWHGQLFQAARPLVESSAKNMDSKKKKKYLMFTRSANITERWKLDLHIGDDVRGGGKRMIPEQGVEATRIWLHIHRKFSVPFLSPDERFVVVPGRGDGTTFNLVADELLRLKGEGIVKGFGPISRNGAFWVTLTKSGMPTNDHVYDFV